MEGISGMSNLDDFLGGGTSAGGGGGVPLGGLIETSKFMPELTGYKKANVRQTLLQSEFADLYAAIGAQPDVSPQLSAVSDQNTFNGELDHTINTFELKIDDGTNFGNPTSMFRASDDIWFAWVGAGIFYTTTGLNGTWAQLPSVSESAQNQMQAMQGAYDPVNGYVVLISDRHVLCNQTANDFTSWTEYDLYNGNEYLRYVYFADGHFVIGFTTDFSNGQASVAWTDDPRFQANWTIHANIFWFQSEQSHQASSRGQMCGYYSAALGAHVMIAGVLNWSASQNEFELWYNTDLVNNTQFTENTVVTAATLNSSSSSSMIFGPMFDSGDDLVWLCRFLNIDYVFVWDDVTAGWKRQIYMHGDIAFSYQQHMIPVDIPEMNYPGQLFMQDAIMYGYHWDGSEFSSGRSDEYKMYYDNSELNWSSYGNSRDMVQWDSVGKTMVCWAKPDTSQTGDYYLWRYPFYTYDTTTEFAIRPVTHDDSEIVYQMRVT